MELNYITSVIIEESIDIHRKLGPGLLESVYEEVLYYRLTERGFYVTRQEIISLVFDGIVLPKVFRADLIVEKTVIVELKSQEKIPPVDYKILLTQLKLSKLPVALMINFYEILLKNGIRRFVN